MPEYLRISSRELRNPLPIKLYAGHKGSHTYCLPYCAIQDFEYNRLILKLYLCLCRMNIHIHLLWRNIKKEIIRGEEPIGKQLVISLLHRLVKECAPEVSPIYKHILVLLALFCKQRISNISPNGDHSSLDSNIHKVFGSSHSIYLHYALLKVCNRGQMKENL